MSYQITNQKDLRKAFWQDNSNVSRRRIPNEDSHLGKPTRYVTDTYCAFVDWIDMLARDGVISESLAQRATLD